jgi:DeoR/GlpR family transcriptional regulator of sugar metabolism
MQAVERRNQMIEKLRIDKIVSVHDLALFFKTTDMTIRRDLADLERKGLINPQLRRRGVQRKSGDTNPNFSRGRARKKRRKRCWGKKRESGDRGRQHRNRHRNHALEVAKHVRDISDLTVITASIP